MNHPRHRLQHRQPDDMEAIVRRPPGRVPRRPENLPPISPVLSMTPVASLDEPLDDPLRRNRLSLARHLDTWAVIHAPAGSW